MTEAQAYQFDIVATNSRMLACVGLGSLLIQSFLGSPTAHATNRVQQTVPSITNALGKYTFEGLNFTTKAYEAEALRLLIQEANDLASELKLPEKLPITGPDLKQVFICKYGISQIEPRGIGNVRTRNYAYYVSVDHKLSYVERPQQEKECFDWVDRYQWPKSQIDTNAAYSLATQWLAAARMDIQRLNKDCLVKAEPDRFWNGKLNSTNAFVPIYWVSWRSPENIRAGYGNVASVRMFLPTKTLITLRVEESKYNLRQPLVFTNLNTLLAEPKNP